MTFTAPLEDEVPVLIVGGGGSADDPRSALAGALSQILARSVATRLVAAGSEVTS